MKRTIAILAAAAALVAAPSVAAQTATFTPWSIATNLESVPGTSAELNTPFLDGCPFTDPDGLSLYLASNRPGGLGGIDIWVAQRAHEHAPWGAPENLGAPINSAADDFCPSPTRGRKFLFVSTRLGGCGGSDIYVVRRHGTGWSEPRNLGCDVNSDAAEAGPVYLPERRLLYFSSTRPGGFAPEAGGIPDADIYVSKRSKHGGWSSLMLVPAVNSVANDARPHLSLDGREMVFDSDRPGTLGGPDLWSSTLGKGGWSAPVNLGPNVNSVAAETRGSFSDGGRTLYFGSTRVGSEPGPTGAPSQDLYVATREPVRRDTINCAEPPYDNVIAGTIQGNLEISLYGTVCLVVGTVEGDVTVRNADPRCQSRPPFVALDVQGGRLEGDVKAIGERCVMVWLNDGALVGGDVVYAAKGNLGFLGDGPGATVLEDVLLKNGLLWATGTATTNRIEGSLRCLGGLPVGSADLATETNWDGAGISPEDPTPDVDGTIGERYDC